LRWHDLVALTLCKLKWAHPSRCPTLKKLHLSCYLLQRIFPRFWDTAISADSLRLELLGTPIHLTRFCLAIQSARNLPYSIVLSAVTKQ